MARLSREEFTNKYNDMLNAEDYVYDRDSLLIPLMEDIADSVGEIDNAEIDTLRAELEKYKKDYTDLQERYKQRFLGIIDDAELKDIKDDKPLLDELIEEEVIDIKEI